MAVELTRKPHEIAPAKSFCSLVGCLRSRSFAMNSNTRNILAVRNVITIPEIRFGGRKNKYVSEIKT